jgi:vacuolar-type H+-ATPase subunit F/Vma7
MCTYYNVYIKVHFVFTDTPRHDIEEAFRGFLKRDDIAIILINQMVRM